MKCQEFAKDVEREVDEDNEKAVKGFLKKMLREIDEAERILTKRKEQYQIYLDMTVDDLYGRRNDM